MDAPLAHVPVLLQEVLGLLAPAGRKVLVDCTVGLGGHSEALLEAAGPEAFLIGSDVDESNLLSAKKRLERFGPRVRLFQANFAELDQVLAEAQTPAADVVLADLGVASSQLDDPQRGLSFAAEGPLDMRLDPRLARTAGDIVNATEETQLANLIYELGEERYSRRIARAIVAARRSEVIRTTGRLADIIMSAMPGAVRRSRLGVHPATRTFQALRLAVNDEMGSLARLLKLLPRLLSHGGRAAIISFHSLEDRQVKQAFAQWSATGEARVLTKKPITANEDEIYVNPRSRSAKLRGVEKL
jgi:16S rRNA (cytosine1402-N4)-methyltransferase